MPFTSRVAFFVLLTTTSIALGSAGEPTSGKTFGAAPTIAEAHPLSSVLAETDKYKTRDVAVEAELKQVCTKKGCWAVLSQAGSEVRMTFKDYGFFIPKDSTGKRVLAQGRIIEKKMTEKMRRHYLEDAGAPAAEIEKIKGDATEKSFVASGVRFLN